MQNDKSPENYGLSKKNYETIWNDTKNKDIFSMFIKEGFLVTTDIGNTFDLANHNIFN